ncbi:tRNA (adenosine(37)-N6)-threonylcarbamoyltransferase complex dimerization subunit type 1 TsaB [Patescibacteria group bacterium]
MILFINTSKVGKLDVFLIKDNNSRAQLSLAGNYKVSENLLKLIDKLLENNNITKKQLKGIICIAGPGPFTSLRIAVTIANTLAYTLKIPVVDVIDDQEHNNEKLIEIGLNLINKQQVGTYIKPFYDKEANIT